ncbi:hypothetical protein AB0E01_18525 [Nocardia vinacea]
MGDSALVEVNSVAAAFGLFVDGRVRHLRRERWRPLSAASRY